MTDDLSLEHIGRADGAKLRAARLARKLTQSQLANPDFSVSYVSAIERGKINPSLRTLEIFAKRLGISSTDLLSKQTPFEISGFSAVDASIEDVARMVEYNLPLFVLFTRLRQAGLPLGINEYKLLLEALQGGFGLPDRESLSRLCKTLWVKSIEEEHLLDYHFEHVIQLSFDSEPSSASSRSSSNQAEIIPIANAPGTDSELSSTTSGPVATVVASGGSSSLSSAINPELILKIEDELQVAKAILYTTGLNEESLYDHFDRRDDYFPITTRQMKQSWRYLRRPIREGPSVELDIEATVNKVGRQGILLEPLFVPRRRNLVELLLLIDQDGSMVPFHALSRRLVETALRGGRLGKADIYFFHNCPAEYLYQHPIHQKAKPIQSIIDHLDSNRACILIFSDAGAARGGINPGRAEMTEIFLDRLRSRVRYIAWLNPVPRSRWSGTTAGEVMLSVAMFDLSRRGLDHAISVLRGRTNPYLYSEASI